MAAPSATYRSGKQIDKVQLNVMVDKKSHKVVYAEAGKEFVDVLLSFLTLPLGTIARLVSKESNMQAVRVGSLSSLYQSVADLDEQYLSTPTCKEMLLKPRNSMEDYCRKLKLNIDHTEPMEYFRCENWECNRRDSGCYLSTYRNQKCSCGIIMDKEVFPKCLNLESGLVKETATFIVSDDLNVMPNVFGTVVHLLQKLGVNNTDTFQKLTVDFTKKEVIDLLKFSLLSKTPLTDFIFNKEPFLSNSIIRSLSQIGITKPVSADVGRQIDLKLMIIKSNGKIMFAEVEEGFVDFLFSFLTFPLGLVLHMLEGFTSLGCLNKLYESMKELSPDRYLISQDLKNKLTKPKVAPLFDLCKPILPIGATATLPLYWCHTHKNSCGYNVDFVKDIVYSNNSYYGVVEKCVRFSYVNPKSRSFKTSSSGEFVKGPSMYMVTDDLVVTPMSSTSAMSYLNETKVTLFDLEEKIIKIGVKEGLAILKASLVSASALTNGLSEFITTIKEPNKKRRTIKEEK